MRAFLWTIVALVAILGLVGLNYGGRGSKLGPTLWLVPTHLSTDQHSSEATNFQPGDRVFHNTFGHGTVVATDGPKLTIDFDAGGRKRVIDAFVVRSEAAPVPGPRGP